MVIYQVNRNTPYILIILDQRDDYSLVVGENRMVTKHLNTFGVEDIVIDPISYANDPHRFVNYDRRLVDLAHNGYIVARSDASKNYLLAVRYEDATVWG